MPDIAFRLATIADVEPLCALVQRAYRGDTARQGWTHEADLLADQRTSPDSLATTIADPGSRVLVAESADTLIGTVTISQLGETRAYMSMLCVDPGLQAAGLGRNLIARCERAAHDDFGATIMEMTVIDKRPELIAFYQRCGYALTGETRPFPVPGDHPFGMVVLERSVG